MWIYVWDKEIKWIYLWDTPIKEVYLWDTKIRPTIINFATQWPAPDGFHVPLNTDRQAVYNVWGALRWSYTSWWAAFGKALKLPKAGGRSPVDANAMSQGSEGYYWSSSRSTADEAYQIYFSSNIAMYNGFRAGGFSVRCFKNSPVVPTSSWTKLYWTSIEAGWIFWSSADWLISLSSNWQSWITIMDKNLWATTVWNYWDAVSAANCGWYFQWGNNYMFPYTWSVTTSSTRVNASAYWPWNYYSSSTFIKYRWRWDTTDNWNLRWWVDGNVPV